MKIHFDNDMYDLCLKSYNYSILVTSTLKLIGMPRATYVLLYFDYRALFLNTLKLRNWTITSTFFFISQLKIGLFDGMEYRL